MSAPRVLIVEDNLLSIELVSCLLRADGLELASTTDARAVAALMDSFRPALVLMDIQMPGIDGLTLTRRIKADPAQRHVVVLAFTAYAMKGDEQRMREAGCDGYIAKPIDVATFSHTVRSHLRNPQAGDQT